MTYDDAKNEFMTFYRDSYDLWGSAMGMLFDVADTLYWHRGITLATYCPGIAEDIQTEWLHDMSDTDLLRFGKVLSRYVSILDAQGYSY